LAGSETAITLTSTLAGTLHWDDDIADGTAFAKNAPGISFHPSVAQTKKAAAGTKE